jgi:hypothetical protein
MIFTIKKDKDGIQIIEAGKEPKWTDKDMIKFANSIQDDCYHTGIYEYSIDEKLKEYEECRQNKDI